MKLTYAESDFRGDDTLERVVSLSPPAAMALYFAMVEHGDEAITDYGKYISSDQADDLANEIMQSAFDCVMADKRFEMSSYGTVPTFTLMVAAAGANKYYGRLMTSHDGEGNWAKKIAVAQDLAKVLDYEITAQQMIAEYAQLTSETV